MRLAQTVIVLTLVAVPCVLADAPKNKNLRIGLMDTLFRDIDEGSIKSSVDQFQSMMEKETGLKGSSAHVKDWQQLAKDVADGKYDIGVFHGYELAWARDKNPKLKALAIAVNQKDEPKAILIVRNDSKSTGLGDLKGLNLAMPTQSKGHCWLFLDRACDKLGNEPAKYFGKIAASETTEDALDDVVDGNVDAALVDEVGLERFRSRKPKRFEKLKELEKSAAFPSPAIVYQEGNLDEGTRRKIFDALMNAPKNPEGKQMLTVWRLSSFERVPKGYDRTVDDILKLYPAK